MDLDLESQDPQSATVGAGQASVASLALDQLMDAVGLRVRQELSTLAVTPYDPHQLSVGSRGRQYRLASPYQPEQWLGQPPAGPSTSAPTAVASASAGIPVPSGSACELPILLG